MNDHPSGSLPPPLPEPTPAPDARPTEALPATPGPPTGGELAEAPGRRFRDRLWSLRAVIAVALASVIIGGLGGAALAKVSEGGDDGRLGPGHGRFHRGGPGGPPGFMGGGPRHRSGPDGRGTAPGPWGQYAPPGPVPGGQPTAPGASPAP